MDFLTLISPLALVPVITMITGILKAMPKIPVGSNNAKMAATIISLIVVIGSGLSSGIVTLDKVPDLETIGSLSAATGTYAVLSIGFWEVIKKYVKRVINYIQLMV